MNKKIVAQNVTVLIGVDVHTASHVVTVKVAGQEITNYCLVWISIALRKESAGRV